MRGRVKDTDIVNTASIASGQGFRLRALLREQGGGAVDDPSGARSWAEQGITGNGFAPVVSTPLWKDLDRASAERDDKAAGEPPAEFSAGTLVRRPATPDDITPTAHFLASADSDYTTGQVTMIDSGMVLV